MPWGTGTTLQTEPTLQGPFIHEEAGHEDLFSVHLVAAEDPIRPIVSQRCDCRQNRISPGCTRSNEVHHHHRAPCGHGVVSPNVPVAHLLHELIPGLQFFSGHGSGKQGDVGVGGPGKIGQNVAREAPTEEWWLFPEPSDP